MRGEQLRDHVLERDVLDRDIDDGAGAENFLGDGDDVFARSAHGELAGLSVTLGFAMLRAPGLGETGGAGEKRDDFFPAAGPAFQAVERAVVNFPALVNHDNAFAEFLDVGHVMAREQDRDAVFAVVLAQKLPDVFLRNHIEPDRRLVEKQHARAMQQCGDEFHLHPFAEGKFADHDVEFFLHVEERDEFIERGFELIGRQAVDRAQEMK